MDTIQYRSTLDCSFRYQIVQNLLSLFTRNKSSTVSRDLFQNLQSGPLELVSPLLFKRFSGLRLHLCRGYHGAGVEFRLFQIYLALFNNDVRPLVGFDDLLLTFDLRLLQKRFPLLLSLHPVHEFVSLGLLNGHLHFTFGLDLLHPAGTFCLFFHLSLFDDEPLHFGLDLLYLPGILFHNCLKFRDRLVLDDAQFVFESFFFFLHFGLEGCRSLQPLLQLVREFDICDFHVHDLDSI
mmetsp:Transcript_9862/g.21999  ORF Transcript_9862/g.21999 Transcript_9862/m.21999 type:complete len:237 (+) Transcript_9862:111-821(+)